MPTSASSATLNADAQPTLRLSFIKPMQVPDPIEDDLYWNTSTEVQADLITYDGPESVFWAAGTEQCRYPTNSIVTVEIYVTAPPKTKTYTVESARQEHAQAYARWTAEDDAALLQRQADGISVDDLAAEFDRKPSAIRSRLGRLLAPDAPQ